MSGVVGAGFDSGVVGGYLQAHGGHQLGDVRVPRRISASGWPTAGDALSILLQMVGPAPVAGRGAYKVDLLARDLAEQYLSLGADLMILEGPTVIAWAIITEVTHTGDPTNRR